MGKWRRIMGLVAGALIVAPLPAVFGAGTAAASAPSWAVVPHTQPIVGSGTLYATACDAAECVAVGASPTAPYMSTTLAERRAGSGWVRVSTPALAGATSSVLSGVTCPAPHDCVAVGTENLSKGSNALVEHWNGTSWSVATSVNGHGYSNALNGVWCGSVSDCLAVGESDQATLIERWDGHTWHVQPSPSPTRNDSVNSLLAVTCASANSCFATGTENMDGDDDANTLVEHWDGSRWSIVPSPSPSDGNYAGLSSIACTSVGNCVAVGYANYRPIIERWNGARWSIDLYPAADGSFDGVACTGPSRCEVVGDHYGPAVAESWDGHRWSTKPFPQSGQTAYAFGVACLSNGHCDAVGQGAFGPLAADWNTTVWTPVAADRVQTTASSTLASVSCASPTNCVAVGTLINQGYGLVERFDGHAWSADSGAAQPGELSGVSCARATACMAVGVRYVDNDTVLTSEQWNGSRWSLRAIPTPPHADYGASLASVSCASPSDCMAVGSYTPPAPNNVPTAFAEHWSGMRWSIVPMPDVPDANFRAVTCVAVAACTAVGDRDTAPLVERWNGAHWTVATTPGLIGLDDDLLGVSCADSQHCEAVGYVYRSYHDDEATALVLVGNGAQWSVQPSSTTEAQDRRLTGVICRSASDCTAVGHETTDTTGNEQSFVAHWDGTNWSFVAVLAGAAPVVELGAIAALPTRDVAVGWQSSGLGQPQSNVIATGG